MNILVISHEYPPVGGGGANACMYLAKEYARQGHNVDILTVCFDGLRIHETININTACINIYRINAKRKRKESCSFNEMYDFITKARSFCDELILDRREKSEPYDICQVFFGIPSGPIGLYVKMKYKIPYIIRFGGGDIPGFQERFSMIYKIIGPAIKIIWKNADGLVANSNGLKRLAENFCRRYPIEVFPNGVDTTVFYPKNITVYGETIELLFISRLIERKGLQYLIPKLKEIQETCGRNIHLTIVGDGPYRNTLEEIVKDYHCESLVSFEGQKEKRDLLSYYQRGDIFVFPSKREGMPNAVLEAMACGLPIVMSPCQGSEELINENGIVSSPDLEQFYKSVIELLKNDNKVLEEYGQNSRKLAISTFSWESVSNNYISLFEKVIKKREIVK